MSFWRILQSSTQFIDRHIFVSSAKRQIFVPEVIPVLISFMNRTNYKGLSIDPCGTPELTGEESEKTFSSATH